MNKINTSIYLDPDLLVWLKTEAVRQRCSMAQVIRIAIVKLMGQTKENK